MNSTLFVEAENRERKKKEEEDERKTKELIKKLTKPVSTDNPLEVMDETDVDYLKDFSEQLSKLNLKAIVGGKCRIEKVWTKELADKFEKKWTELKIKYKYHIGSV